MAFEKKTKKIKYRLWVFKSLTNVNEAIIKLFGGMPSRTRDQLIICQAQI